MKQEEVTDEVMVLVKSSSNSCAGSWEAEKESRGAGEDREKPLGI